MPERAERGLRVLGPTLVLDLGRDLDQVLDLGLGDQILPQGTGVYM